MENNIDQYKVYLEELKNESEYYNHMIASDQGQINLLHKQIELSRRRKTISDNQIELIEKHLKILNYK